LMCTVTVAWL